MTCEVHRCSLHVFSLRRKATLEEMSRHLEQLGKPKVSGKTIQMKLEGQLISLKVCAPPEGGKICAPQNSLFAAKSAQIRQKFHATEITANSRNPPQTRGRFQLANFPPGPPSPSLPPLFMRTQRASHEPRGRNTEETKLARKMFVEQASVMFQMDVAPIYLDETGFNLWQTKRYARAPVGERATVKCESSPGRNVTLVAAISPAVGVVHFRVQDQPLNKSNFATFIAELVPRAIAMGRPTVVILDNLRAHDSTTLNDLLTPRNISYLFLPAYSPMLNAIELAFNTIKCESRKQLSQHRLELAQIDQAPRGQKTYLRQQLVHRILEASVHVVDATQCSAWHSHCLSFYTAAMLYSDM